MRKKNLSKGIQGAHGYFSVFFFFFFSVSVCVFVFLFYTYLLSLFLRLSSGCRAIFFFFQFDDTGIMLCIWGATISLFVWSFTTPYPHHHVEGKLIEIRVTKKAWKKRKFGSFFYFISWTLFISVVGLD